MSSINFSKILRERPDLAAVVKTVELWLDKHASVRAIDPLRIVRESHGAKLHEVAELFRELESRGVVEGTFRLKKSDGRLVGDDFDSPDEIPEDVEDRFGDVHHRDKCDIALVFRVAG
jgi:hypothetical protein